MLPPPQGCHRHRSWGAQQGRHGPEGGVLHMQGGGYLAPQFHSIVRPGVAHASDKILQCLHQGEGFAELRGQATDKVGCQIY